MARLAAERLGEPVLTPPARRRRLGAGATSGWSRGGERLDRRAAGADDQRLPRLAGGLERGGSRRRARATTCRRRSRRRRRPAAARAAARPRAAISRPRPKNLPASLSWNDASPAYGRIGERARAARRPGRNGSERGGQRVGARPPLARVALRRQRSTAAISAGGTPGGAAHAERRHRAARAA